jgi:hypothetical protein
METKLTKDQLDEMHAGVLNLRNAMWELVNLVVAQKSGDSDEFCNKYPFTASLDELSAEVDEWVSSIETARESAIMNDQIVSDLKWLADRNWFKKKKAV